MRRRPGWQLLELMIPRDGVVPGSIPGLAFSFSSYSSSEGKENGCEEHDRQRNEKMKVKLVGERVKRLEGRSVV